MNRTAALLIVVTACHKQEATPEFHAVAAPSETPSVVAAAAPSELASDAPSAIASATADAGGGTGEVIGLGPMGTVPHERFGAVHRASPRIRQGTTTVNGRLPPDVVQRIVRQSFGRFRLCYDNGLRSDPKLVGTVTTKFVIDATGAVSKTERDPSTTLTDPGIVSCIVNAFTNMSFPQPEGGIVTVVYPVILEPPAE